MAESAVQVPSGPSLEAILWRAMDRFASDAPSVIDAEEFATHIADAFDGDVPAEAFVNKFFEGELKGAPKPQDMAAAIVTASKKRLQSYEFDLRRLEYVVVEEKDELVVVSDLGQFSLASDDGLSRAVQSAVVPGPAARLGGKVGPEPRAMLIRKNGEMVGIDVTRLALALQKAKISQVTAPRVEAPGARLAPYAPVKRTLSAEREARVLRQDARTRQALAVPPPPARLEKPAKPSSATVLLVMPDGTLAKPAMGSASRFRDMVSDWVAKAAGLAKGEGKQGSRYSVDGQRVVAALSASGKAAGDLGQAALARGAGLAAVRSMDSNIRVLGDDELAAAVARGAKLVSATTNEKGFWVQPEAFFAPSQHDRDRALAATAPKKQAPAAITSDPWADWALQVSGRAASALRGLPGAGDVARGQRLADLVDPSQVQAGGAQGQLSSPARRVLAFRAPDGSLVVQRDSGAVRLAAQGRPQLDFGSLPALPGGDDVPRGGALAPRTGALPATALAALSMAIERTASAGGYKLPGVRLESSGDAFNVGSAMDARLAADHPRRQRVMLMHSPEVNGGGQITRMLLSMPFPDSGALHVGSDLSSALATFMDGPAVPTSGSSGGASAGSVFGALVASAPLDGGAASDFPALNESAMSRAREAWLALQQSDAAPFVSGSAQLAGLPALLQRALLASGEWSAGPGASVPSAVRDFAMASPFDLPELVAAGDLGGAFAPELSLGREPGPGQQEIVIPMPLWAQMGRGRISSTDQIMASPLAPSGFEPPLGSYRLVQPPQVDLTNGAPSGTPGTVRIVGPTNLTLAGTPTQGVRASSLGGQFVLGTIPLDDGRTAVGRRGRIRIGAPLDPSLLPARGAPRAGELSTSLASSGAPAGSGLAGSSVSGAAGAMRLPRIPNPDLSMLAGTYVDGSFTASRPMAGSLSGALRLSSDVNGRMHPSAPGYGNLNLSSALASAAALAMSASRAATERARVGDDTFIAGLRPGAWSGHAPGAPGYQTWAYGQSGARHSQSVGGVDLSSLARPTYPSLPTSLRFRYVSSPLWWASNPLSAQGEGDGAPGSGVARRQLAGGLRAANSAAAIWRSIFVGGGGDDTGGMDRGWDTSGADGMSSIAARGRSSMAAAAVVSGGAGAGSGGSETIYIAMDKSGRAGTTTKRESRLAPVEMSIVAAIPSAPPAVETMTSGAAEGATKPHARSRKAQAHEHKDDAVSHSKIEGSVDAVAQRIYHRIRRRIANDRERFGG